MLKKTEKKGKNPTCLTHSLVTGYVFNMFEESIIIAAGLSSKNIFTSPYQKKLLAYLVKMLWADGSFSDPITILNAYQLWKEYHRIEHFKRSGQSEKQREKQWAKDYFIQLKALTVLLLSFIRSELDKSIDGNFAFTKKKKQILLPIVYFLTNPVGFFFYSSDRKWMLWLVKSNIA